MRERPTVGQRLYSLNIGNATRNVDQKLTPVVVTKVGRKYFYAGESAEAWKQVKYDLESWGEVSDYCANSCLYIFEEEWEDENLRQIIGREISNSLRYASDWSKLPLDILRKVKELVL